MRFELRFELQDVPYWATRYEYPLEARLENEIAPRARQLGYFTKEDFLDLCYWKTPRSQPNCARNTPDYIEAVTRTALSTANEQLRIEVLTLLRGVRWPTASVVLHFAHEEPYPILDFRALWTLGIEQVPRYTFDVWWAYTTTCRDLAERAGVSMRDLDRALWQYSKENQ